MQILQWSLNGQICKKKKRFGDASCPPKQGDRNEEKKSVPTEKIVIVVIIDISHNKKDGAEMINVKVGGDRAIKANRDKSEGRNW